MGISCFCASLDSDLTSIGCGLNFLITGDLGGKVGSSLFTASKSPTSFCLVGGGVCSSVFLSKEALFCFAMSFAVGLMLTPSSSLVFARMSVLSDTAEGPDVVEEEETILSL